MRRPAEETCGDHTTAKVHRTSREDDEFAAAWMEHVYPLRFKHGFSVAYAGVLDESDDFVCVITDNDEGDWDTKEAAYYASEEHAVLEPVLAPLIAGGDVWFVNSVVPSD